ncbi:MAG: TetR/AcrR family transcriptional regulator [Pirellulales bacterium]
MPTSTRQRLIEAAVRRFYRDGFRNVGIDQILGDVGISKTAFYKHFASKEDLMLAALEGQNQWLQNTFRTFVRERASTPVGQLHAVLDVVEQLIESDEFHGCIFVKALMEFPLRHEPVHVAAAQSKQAIEDFVHILASEAEADDPRSLAREMCLLMEGAYVTRHATGNVHTIDMARRMARMLIEDRCARASGAASEPVAG